VKVNDGVVVACVDVGEALPVVLVDAIDAGVSVKVPVGASVFVEVSATTTGVLLGAIVADGIASKVCCAKTSAVALRSTEGAGDAVAGAGRHPLMIKPNAMTGIKILFISCSFFVN
jgi:hypothetical protein